MIELGPILEPNNNILLTQFRLKDLLRKSVVYFKQI